MPSYRYKGRRGHSGHHLGEQEASENRRRVRRVIHEVRSHHSVNTEGGSTRGAQNTRCVKGKYTRLCHRMNSRCVKEVIHDVMSHNAQNTRCVKG